MNVQIPTKQLEDKKKAKLEFYMKIKTKAKDPKEVTKDTRPQSTETKRVLGARPSRKI